MPAKISSIEAGSIAEELEIQAGSELISINGIKLRDYIDYQYAVMNEELEFEIKNLDGDIEIYEIEKDFDEELGFVFESAIFDKIKPCANNCIFCFVDQQPKGLRESLYIKDDDYRLSYLQGTYVTLTNLTKKDKERIKLMHLGPLYVSVHTTNPELRAKMLKNKNAANLLKELDFLKENDIPIHTQIVLCPTFNDGEELKRTLNDLWKYKSILGSIAIVPVGITKYRKEKLEQVTKQIAIETIKIVDDFNKKVKKNIASVSDEFFLLAEIELPDKKYYNGFSQLEDGVGSLRCLLDDFNKRIKKVPKSAKNMAQYTIACSVSAKNAFLMFAEELNKIENVDLNVIPIKSEFWGKDVNVAGLITAQDLINQLRNKCFKNVIIPSIVLRPYTTEFLDGLTIQDVEKELNIKLHVTKDIYSTKELFELLFK
jgi:putative radical SAM enzyme (TIGR03279 family)